MIKERPSTGVLLVNLGTPDSPKVADVRRYLIEFLTDARVINLPWWRRQLLVRGVIVPRRVKGSSEAYQKIWTAEGSPLLYWGNRVKTLLQNALGSDFLVGLGMRYQNPSLSTALTNMVHAGIRRLVVLPLFPQYASATSGSVQEHVMNLLRRQHIIPQITIIDHFYDHPTMIAAFCEQAKKRNLKEYDHILFSFHGLPVEQLQKADRQGKCCKLKDCCLKASKLKTHCYAAQCYATARAISKQLGLSSSEYSLCFQSRLGKAPWLTPYASESIAECARKGYKKLLVFSPSFVCDCLETLFEIGMEYADEFKKAGGERLDLVEGLNDHPLWINALTEIVGNDKPF